MIGDISEDYCPDCDKITEHKEVDDDLFDLAIECLDCHTIWEFDDYEN